ncbi:MAG: ribonuclease HII [Candidatus Woykebacteria bacterium RIFCSPHIGHO2_12_FULL_45_10]|uniref:Ribonuclease HII n=1 Tax=Candidatus Woykebacteria bacterium RIFCSPHIGHO2_12_FULL_45_10 TaxID=1802603 RepID=A0A1G1WQ69_9BACT|nr:MAG: ribonuclease HII [Candidatus Woykebacteria bacterium RIFCSPHIGHO2_12_FULL_45_10]
MVAAGWKYERRLWRQGYKFVAGLDEVGRGSWVGPIVAAAVIFPPFCHFPKKLFDSKLLNAPRREELAQLIQKHALAITLGTVDVITINTIGIGKANQKAFRKAINKLPARPDFLLVDAFYIRAIKKAKQLPLKKGDQLSASIAAASIVAKVYRDKILADLDKEFPEYGFVSNKGYGTKAHRMAIAQNALSSVHRTSFRLEPYLGSRVDRT